MMTIAQILLFVCIIAIEERNREPRQLTEAERAELNRASYAKAPPLPPAPLGPAYRESRLQEMIRYGRAYRCYSQDDRKMLNQVLLGKPELPWLLVIFSFPR